MHDEGNQLLESNIFGFLPWLNFCRDLMVFVEHICACCQGWMRSKGWRAEGARETERAGLRIKSHTHKNIIGIFSHPSVVRRHSHLFASPATHLILQEMYCRCHEY